MDLNTGTSASHLDLHVLSLAEEKLREMITPFEETLSVPWVKEPGWTSEKSSHQLRADFRHMWARRNTAYGIRPHGSQP